MTTVPLPMPYKTRPIIMVGKLLLPVEKATSTLPTVIRIVVAIEPKAVPKLSRTIPPKTGSTVFTIETLDWIAPYWEFDMPKSYILS